MVELKGFLKIEVDFTKSKTSGIAVGFNNLSAATAVQTLGSAGSVRLIWSENVSIDETDVEITDSLSQPLQFTLSGSRSRVTTLDPAQLLVGDAVFIPTHCSPTDLDCEGDVDLFDFTGFQEAFARP
jgi:hypothetical protein